MFIQHNFKVKLSKQNSKLSKQNSAIKSHSAKTISLHIM